MKIQSQPNSWSCVPTAFAMVAGVSVDEVFKDLGDDGSEIVHPSLIEPLCRRSFSWTQMVWWMYTRGWAAFPFIIESIQSPMCHDEFQCVYRLPAPLVMLTQSKFSGVFLGTSVKGNLHAVAWDHEYGLVYDPSGIVRRELELEVAGFIACSRLP